jgi:hypothetical protein
MLQSLSNVAEFIKWLHLWQIWLLSGLNQRFNWLSQNFGFILNVSLLFSLIKPMLRRWTSTNFKFLFFGGVGLSRLTSLQFIQYHVAGFYKPTIPQSPPSHLRDYSTCNNARLEFSTIFVPSFDPYEWCLKNCLHSGGLNPGPLGHESSALTTRPRLLAN